jgi:integrase
MRSSLHAFWTWLRRRRIIRFDQVPEIPHVAYKLGYRRIVDKRTQRTILDEIGRLSAPKNPKIPLAIEWLASYIAIRPGELLSIKEKDIDLERRSLFIPHPKEGTPKWIPLTDEDVERARALKEAYPGFSDQHFFRSCKGEKGVAPDVPFNQKRLYKWWKKACANLGSWEWICTGGRGTLRLLR